MTSLEKAINLGYLFLTLKPKKKHINTCTIFFCMYWCVSIYSEECFWPQYMYPKLCPFKGYRWFPLGKLSHLGLEQLLTAHFGEGLFSKNLHDIQKKQRKISLNKIFYHLIFLMLVLFPASNCLTRTVLSLLTIILTWKYQSKEGTLWTLFQNWQTSHSPTNKLISVFLLFDISIFYSS